MKLTPYTLALAAAMAFAPGRAQPTVREQGIDFTMGQWRGTAPLTGTTAPPPIASVVAR